MKEMSVRQTREEAIEAIRSVNKYLADETISVQDRQGILEKAEKCEKDLRDGHYLVVVLGAFNVGKTMLLNAFLGGEYLPGKAQECTRQLTKVRHSLTPYIDVALKNVPSGLMELLQATCDKLDADISGPEIKEDFETITIKPRTVDPTHFKKVCEVFLDARWGENGDKHDKKLQKKLDDSLNSVTLALPMPDWAEDIVLVDSPGVQSLSETRVSITYNLIPRSHLVLLMLDSDTAGTKSDRDFIEMIAQQQMRKIFFILNKKDRLEESDVREAKLALLQALPKRLNKPEIYPVSSLYGLRAKQLASGTKNCMELEAEKALLGLLFGIAGLPDAQKPHAYEQSLQEASNFETLTHRISKWLREENKEMAVTEKGWRFVREQANQLVTMMQNEIALATDPSVLDALRADAEQIRKNQNDLHNRSLKAVANFRTRASGGVIDGIRYDGIDTIVDEHFSANACESVVDDVKNWLKNDGLEKVKKDLAVMEKKINELLQKMFAEGNAAVQGALEKSVSNLQSELRDIMVESHSDLPHVGQLSGKGAFDTGAILDYLYRTGTGAAGVAATGALIGAFLTSWSGPGAALGAGIGAALGAAWGAMASYFYSDDTRIENLTADAKKYIEKYVLTGGEIKIDDPQTKQPGTETIVPVAKEMKKLAGKAVESIEKDYGKELNKVFENMEKELTRLLEEGEAIQAEGEKVRDRNQPKIDELMPLLHRAQKILGKKGHDP